MPRKKSPAQLDREIAEALARRAPRQRRRRHHASRQAGADAWDVAMDALLEHDPARAAKLVRQIRREHGATVNATPEFSQAVREVPQDVRDRFFELVEQDPDGGERPARYKLTKPTYRHFTLKIYPGRGGPPRLLWFRAVPPETWLDASERLTTAGVVESGKAGRTSEHGGWMLSVDPADYDETRAKSLPGVPSLT